MSSQPNNVLDNLRDWIKTLSDQTEIESVAEKLCGFCLLRFLNVWHTNSLYSSNDQKDVWKHFGINVQNDAICSVCLGTLKKCPEYAKSIVDDLQTRGYCVDKVYSLAIKTPTSILVRERSMGVHLKRSFEGFSRLNGTQPVVDIKEIAKSIIKSEIEKLSPDLTQDADSPLAILLNIAHPESEQDHIFLSTVGGAPLKLRSMRQNRKKVMVGDSKQAIIDALKAVSDVQLVENYKCPPVCPEKDATIESIDTKRESIYIGGRYLKLQRNVSQTPFIIDGKRVTEHSVSESIGDPLLGLIKADSYNFVGAGREDADVRMLGEGRPFYLEFFNPRYPKPTRADLEEIEKQINAKSPLLVAARRLTLLSKSSTKIIKEGEQEKKKSYSALVWLPIKLSDQKLSEIKEYETKELVIQQKTPVRVLHRRAPLTRPKTIYRMSVKFLGSSGGDSDKDNSDGNGYFYQVRLNTEAGTYIKEFIHGDLGRTVPSFSVLCSLDVADIIELDVEEVVLEFPPPSPK